MLTLKEEFIKLIKQHNILDIEEPHWNRFEIEQTTVCRDLKKVRAYILKHTGKKNGLYAYKNVNGDLLYIGKGKPISDRLYSHFIENYKQVSGDRTGKWHRFFNTHHGILHIYWIELEDESIRKFVEHILTDELQPEFIAFEK